MPWVRLHGTKDYLYIARQIGNFPEVRSVVNFSSSLLEQIELYGQGVQDDHQALCRRPPEDLTPSEISWLIQNSFFGIPERLIHPYRPYYELMAKVGREQSLSIQEIRDLQVWSNLAWMDPQWKREEPLGRELLTKAGHFTEEEKNLLLKAQPDLLAAIIPAYRALEETGQVEISASPWAHPILPLLCDTRIAQQTNPGMPLPVEAYSFPSDATWHLGNAVRQHTCWFGRSPRGLWPSEGSVSSAILPLIAEAGFRWLATDEEILWK